MMNEFSLMTKDATEAAKDIKEGVKELGDKKICEDITVKDAAKTGVVMGVTYATGGTAAVAGYAGSKLLGVAGKEIALEAGCSEKTASNIETGTRIAGSMITGAAADGISGMEDIGEVGEAVGETVDKLDAINYDLPVVKAGELSDVGSNLIASDVTAGVDKLDLPVAVNTEKANETFTGVVAKFDDSTVNEGVVNAETNLIKLDTRNQSLEGTVHPETGVPFVRKVIDIGDGMKVEGVFPDFDSKFDVQLPEGMLKSSDVVQFNECNNQLKEAVEASIDKYKSIFDKEQIEQILDGETPDGYTWHHDAEVGEMELVESDIHMKTGHTGGRTVWGGGNENR